MKTKKLIFILPVLLLTGVAISSFFQYHPPYEPVMMLREDMEEAIKIQPPRPIENSGKIWVYEHYIFVIDRYKGIHVINNLDTQNPFKEAFIHIDGITDVAVKPGGIIFANNAVDLISVKPSADFTSLEVLSRKRESLSEIKPPDGGDYTVYFANRPENAVIVRWKTYSN